jgi:ribosomal protein S8
LSEPIERVFAWEDKFQRLLMRFERTSKLHYALKTLALKKKQILKEISRLSVPNFSKYVRFLELSTFLDQGQLI